jgi:hypothetical protein
VIKGLQSKSEIVLFPEKKEDQSVSFLDVTKAKNELHFACEYSLVEAFADLAKE